MVINSLDGRGVDACAACILEKSVHLPHKDMDMDERVSISNGSIST